MLGTNGKDIKATIKRIEMAYFEASRESKSGLDKEKKKKSRHLRSKGE